MKKSLVVGIVMIVLFSLTGIASAAPVTKQLPYTKAVSLGTGLPYTFRFSLWTAETGGTQVWFEDQSMVLASPAISTFLGKVTPLSGVDFSQQLWVQVEQGGSVLGARDIFGPAPYAFWSSTCSQAPGYISGVAPGAGLSGGGTDGDITLAFDAAFGDGRYVNENQANSVTAAMLGSGSVGPIQLANNSVTAAKLQSDAVNNANRAVGTNHIQDSAITSAKIADGSVGAAELATGAVTAAKLANLSVVTGAIQDNAVTSSKIPNNAVTNAKIAAGAATRSKLSGIVAVKVECNGNCGDSNLGQICDGASPGWEPVFVSCKDVKDASGYSCGGDNKCTNIAMVRGNSLGLFCDDTGGWDAIVYCMAP